MPSASSPGGSCSGAPCSLVGWFGGCRTLEGGRGVQPPRPRAVGAQAGACQAGLGCGSSLRTGERLPGLWGGQGVKASLGGPVRAGQAGREGALGSRPAAPCAAGCGGEAQTCLGGHDGG